MNFGPDEYRFRPKPAKRHKVPIYKQLGCEDWGAMYELLLSAGPEIISDAQCELLLARFCFRQNKRRPDVMIVDIQTYFDIGEIMGLSESHVRNRIQAALTKLKEQQEHSSPPRRVSVDR